VINAKPENTLPSRLQGAVKDTGEKAAGQLKKSTGHLCNAALSFTGSSF